MESFMVSDKLKKSRIPARLDFAQSGTGLLLGLFMWAHMILVASILLGKGSFNFVANFMELSFLSSTGEGHPSAVFFAVVIVFTLFIVHAALGMRKFPISWKQHSILRQHMGMIQHDDTNLWYIQAVTGFAMFFLGSVHLYVMLTHPGQIDPYLSADRFVAQSMWPLYLALLIAVELHGTIGLYRLCMKWGWFQGKDARQSRDKMKLLKKRLTIFFLALGLLSFAVFVIIGISHLDQAGEPYDKPAARIETQAPASHTAPEKDIVPAEAATEDEAADTAAAAEQLAAEEGASAEQAAAEEAPAETVSETEESVTEDEAASAEETHQAVEEGEENETVNDEKQVHEE
ncbi:MAG: fumarate reductase cytochrome b subunit [Desulfobacteraceae bacterium]